MRASAETAWRCGRKRTTAQPPLAEESAAVLDDYFHDLRVEPVKEGEGWSKIAGLPRLFPE
jgi:hypothetical protein